uniref:Uncharacterized protein n=1 Tax=Nothobranchius furzeri TaxID=105023 RepID=A0A8C6PVJ9_NOTFU
PLIYVSYFSCGTFGTSCVSLTLVFFLFLQFFAIFAFSTCGSYSGMFKMAVECKNRTDSDLGVEVQFEYPFSLLKAPWVVAIMWDMKVS